LHQIILDCQRELTFEFIRASGPGGQNVNKVATAVQLRFDIRGSAFLDADSKQRMARAAGKRVTPSGVLILQAARYRTQSQNRADAESRFIAILKKSVTPPKKRRPTSASRASKERRLQSKKIRGRIKQIRRTSVEE
jgi:ribosome-associated protein